MNIIEIFILSFVLGALSNEIGGLIGFIGKSNRESVNRTVAFTAGITTSIICFELLIEAFEMSTKYYVVIFTVIGCVFVKILDFLINIFSKEKNNSSKVIVSAMAAHNITEGIAIGAGFSVSKLLGISLLCAIMLHNIPEGMIIGSMLRKESKKIKNMSNVCIIIGVFLGIGALVGALLGNVDDRYIMPNLALSAGAMLYMLSCELIPNMYDIENKSKGIIYILGFLLGCLICKV